MSGIGPAECSILAILLFIALPMLLFWIWMLIDCVTKEPSKGNDKLIWVLVILLTGFLGAAIYFFVRRPKRPAAPDSG